MASRLLDTGNRLTIAVTFVLFVVALFVKGLTHDLLLEAGVFLVSVKLILLARKHELETEKLLRKIDELKELLSNRSLLR